MSGRTRFAALLVAVLAGLFALVAGAAASQAAPGYVDNAAISFNATGSCGGQLAVNGTGFGANEQVTLTLGTSTLATVTAGADGSFNTSVALPAGVSGSHEIVATGSSGATANGTITIGDCTAPQNNGTGGLSNTGVAVLSLAGLGLVLLIGGVFLVASGRRRRTLV